MKLVTIGSVALDSLRTPHGKVTRALGGAAVHASITASYHAPSLGLIGIVGHDFPVQHLRLLKQLGVDIDGIAQTKGKTFHWKGKYLDDMAVAHTLSTELGVFADFNPKVPDAYRRAPFVFLANIEPSLQLKVLKQMRKPKFTLLDTMNFWIESRRSALKNTLRHVDCAVLNDQEVRMLTGEINLVKAARGILRMGPSWLVLKRGEHGATIVGKNIHFSLPAYPTDKVLDPTGAGDSFAGGFIGSLAKAGVVNSKTLKQAMAVGTVMASFNVEGFSVNRTRKLKGTEIRRRLTDLKVMASF